MKKFISILMAVTMIATMVFAFPTPADATLTLVSVDSPYFETYFVTDDTYVYAEVPFTVPHSGYYIIQTFGFFDEYGAPVDTTVVAELYSSDGIINGADGNSGYDNGFLIHDYLEEGELYRLYMLFEENVDFGRLSFTNAVSDFYPSHFPINEYYQIMPLYVYEGTGSSLVPSSNVEPFYQGEFLDQNQQRAMVRLLEYRPQFDVSPSTKAFRISVQCCDCTHVSLVVPYGHDLEWYGGDQVVFDAGQSPVEVVLEEGVPYYLVVYLGMGNQSCQDHSETPVFEIYIEGI